MADPHIGLPLAFGGRRAAIDGPVFLGGRRLRTDVEHVSGNRRFRQDEDERHIGNDEKAAREQRARDNEDARDDRVDAEVARNARAHASEPRVRISRELPSDHGAVPFALVRLFLLAFPLFGDVGPTGQTFHANGGNARAAHTLDLERITAHRELIAHLRHEIERVDQPAGDCLLYTSDAADE